MKRNFGMVLAFLLALPVAAQVSNPPIVNVTTAPSGSCNAGLPNQQVISTGTQYSCQSVTAGVGTWGVVGAGAGGPPTGAAGGALTGTYPNPGLAAATSSTLGGVKPDGTSILNTAGAISATAASVGALSLGGGTLTGTVTGADGGTWSAAGLTSNTSGTAANLSGTPALPNGVTATTQSQGDNSNKLSTTSYAAQVNSFPLIVDGRNLTYTSGTFYQPPIGILASTTTSSTGSMAFPRSGTISGLYVCLTGAQPAGTMVFTFYTGPFGGTLSATSQTLTIASSAAAGCYQTAGASFAYTAGNGLSIQVVENAGGSGATMANIYAEFTNAH